LFASTFSQSSAAGSAIRVQVVIFATTRASMNMAVTAVLESVVLTSVPFRIALPHDLAVSRRRGTLWRIE
jgi:hypothetical protein